MSDDHHPGNSSEIAADQARTPCVPAYQTHLQRIVKELEENKTPFASPRQILSWFDAARRGNRVVSRIRSELKNYNLITLPDFEYEFIDGEVRFSSRPAASPPQSALDSKAPADTQVTTTAPAEQPATPTIATLTSDPTYRIGKLAAANKPLVSVPPDADIKNSGNVNDAARLFSIARNGG